MSQMSTHPPIHSFTHLCTYLHIYLFISLHKGLLSNHTLCPESAHSFVYARNGELFWIEEPRLEFDSSPSPSLSVLDEIYILFETLIMRCGCYLLQGGWVRPTCWYHICNRAFLWLLLSAKLESCSVVLIKEKSTKRLTQN
jgi:hypothetical protein